MKETKIAAPDGCEIEKVEIVNGVAVVTFKKKDPQLPKAWEEFCHVFCDTKGTFYINSVSDIMEARLSRREANRDKNLLPDRETAEAVLSLCQLIQLRNAYNGDWVPDWKDALTEKFVIEFVENEISTDVYRTYACSPLYFKTEELREQFLENFRDLIEKLKPLYGIAL